MSKQRRTIGAIVKIDLGNNLHSYAQILNEAEYAFYDIRTSDELLLEEIENLGLLFRLSVYNSAVTSGRWCKIYKTPLRKEFEKVQPTFIQDKINPKKFSIYDEGKIRSATRSECLGLECCAVWEAEHVESRINDHFDGMENIWVNQLKIK